MDMAALQRTGFQPVNQNIEGNQGLLVDANSVLQGGSVGSLQQQQYSPQVPAPVRMVEICQIFPSAPPPPPQFPFVQLQFPFPPPPFGFNQDFNCQECLQPTFCPGCVQMSQEMMPFFPGGGCVPNGFAPMMSLLPPPNVNPFNGQYFPVPIEQAPQNQVQFPPTGRGLVQLIVNQQLRTVTWSYGPPPLPDTINIGGFPIRTFRPI